MGIAYLASWNMGSLEDGLPFYLMISSSGETTFYIRYAGSGAPNTYYLPDYDANSAELYSHYDIHDMTLRDLLTSPLSTTYADDAFGQILEEALNAGASGESWGGTFTVTFSLTTCKYTISHSSLSFAINGTVGSSSFRLLGFSAAQSAATSHTSTYAVAYSVLSDLDHLSRVSDEYERGNVASLVVSDGGYPLGMARDVPIVYLDWYQQFEPHATTHARKATYHWVAYALPWSFQNLFEHCRTVYPIVVCTEDFYTSYYPIVHLRDDGANFQPERDHPDYDGHWHIPFKTFLFGWVAA